jgi:peptidoglycan/LPS O-acetylase OafA/YrhL
MAEPLALKPDAAHRRLSQLDGLRACAILMVIASHIGVFELGWSGVHLFFVLSGFLITGILRRAREDTHFWGPFYIRRATRILPPLVPFYLFCAFTVALHPRKLWLAYIFFGANIVQSLPHAAVNELTILWSLAVEEHFYFLWPFAIRYMRRGHLILFLAALLLLDPIARAIATPHVADMSPIYFLTCFQLDGLAAGSMLALLTEGERCRVWLRSYAGWLALAAAGLFAGCSLLPAFSRESNTAAFNSVGYSLIVLTFAFVLAYLYLRPESIASRVLSIQPMVFIGAVSYGLYLFNGPAVHTVMRFAPHALHQGRVNMAYTVVGLALAVLVSWLSFRFYETPILGWGRQRASLLSKSSGRSGRTLRDA